MSQHANSLANLKPPFDGSKPGPGRPPGSVSPTSAIRAEYRKRHKEFAKSVIDNAVDGNATAIKMVFDRLDGPIATVIEGDLTLKGYAGFDPDSSFGKTKDEPEKPATVADDVESAK